MFNQTIQEGYSNQIQPIEEISVEELQEEVSICLAENTRLKEALKRSRQQQLTSKKEYDTMFRELQIEQCRLMLTIQEQQNQIRKMAREMNHSSNSSSKNLSRQKDLAFLQQEVATLTENLQKIRDSRRNQASEYKEQLLLLRNIVKQLQNQNHSLSEVQSILKQKIIRLQQEVSAQNQKIFSLEANQQKLRKTYEIQINILQQQHEEIKKLLQDTKQQIAYKTQNQEAKELQMMIYKLRQTHKELVQELDHKTNQTQRLIQQIQNLKESEHCLKQQHYQQKRKISGDLQLLMKGFNDQIINYQNKILFLLEYLEEVELGKTEKMQDMKIKFDKVKQSMMRMVKHIIKA